MLLKKDNLLFFKESSFNVAKLFFDYPNKVFHIRHISKESKLSTTAVISAVNDLEKNNIVKIEKTNITTNVKADLDSKNYVFYKRIFNLYRIKKHLDDIIICFNNPSCVVLFGSYSRGEDIEQSDIDIFVLSPIKDNDLSKIANSIERDLKRRLNFHILPSIEKSQNEFKNALSNGVVLHGYLKVI